MVFVVFFSAYVLSLYTSKFNLSLDHNFLREFIICLGQIVWQTLFLKPYLKNKIWDYLGNMMTVSLIGTLLLVPALLINFSSVFYLIYFGIVVSIMLFEHLRRCKILKLNFLPTISWIIYRTIILITLIYWYV